MADLQRLVLYHHRALALLLLAAPSLVAGSTAQPQGFTISDNVRLVVLDVSVRNSHNQLVSDLSENDFSVFDDGHLRELSHFSNSDQPVTVGLVVDNSGSMVHKRSEVITAGLAFAHESNPNDQFFVVNFNDSVARGLPPNMPFTDNLQLLHQALYFGQSQGRTSLYDAIAYSLRHLERGRYERRTLVVVSDGRDNVSATTLAQLIEAITASRATIYTIGLYDPSSNDLNPRVLRKIADISGGEYFEPKEVSEVAPTLDKISRDIRHRYTLAFIPGQSDSKRATRTIRVVVKRDGHKLRVRTRNRYQL